MLSTGLREVIARREAVLAGRQAYLVMRDEQVATHGRLIEARAPQLDAQVQLTEALRVEDAELCRRLGMDLTNSANPPSNNGPATARQDRPGSGPQPRHQPAQRDPQRCDRNTWMPPMPA